MNRQFFLKKYTRSIKCDVTAVLKTLEKDHIEFNLYGWNGNNLTISEIQNEQQLNSNFKYHFPTFKEPQQNSDKIPPKQNQVKIPIEQVIIDIILLNEQKQTIFCLANGAIYLNVLGLELNKIETQTLIEKPSNVWERAFCKLAYFSYENKQNSSQNKYYLLAIQYSKDIAIYQSNDLSYFKKKEPHIINQEIFQYDEINQVLLILDKDLTLTYFRISQQDHSLENQNINFDICDLQQKLSIETPSDVQGLDFQYKNGIFNIFIMGKMLGIYQYDTNSIQDEDQQNYSPQLIFMFDPFIIKEVKDNIKCNDIKIFCDKRDFQFKKQTVTVIYDRIIIVYKHLDDSYDIITNLNMLQSLEFNLEQVPQNRFQKYFCVYGNDKDTFHVLTYSNAMKVEQSSNIIPRVYVIQEQFKKSQNSN